MKCAVVNETTGEIINIINANPDDPPYPSTILVPIHEEFYRDIRDFVYDVQNSTWNLKPEITSEELLEETLSEDEGLLF